MIDIALGAAIGAAVVFAIMYGLKCIYAKPWPVWPLLPPLDRE